MPPRAYGYEPNFPVFEKCEVNGENAHPHFEFLKESLAFPHDSPLSLMIIPKFIIWSLLCAADIMLGILKNSLLVVMGCLSNVQQKI
ncbi:Glutathione peroxidase 1 [Crotalus adamanteus]|uniref:Glutathione peroxidase 1 n=1 Tax=Crotalus adamanteus TaxID=8729 RepID=A0AAW1C343_CROAD